MKGYSILVSLIIALLAGAAANAKYSGGTGDPNDPYQIATAEDLNDIGNYEEDWNKHFILVSDVNLAGFPGIQFNIIGYFIGWDRSGHQIGKPFTGVFDGNDHKIWNFTWNSSTERKGIGLFGYVGSGGQIKHLGMENVDVNAINGYYVSGLVGINYYGTISDCYLTGSVSMQNFVGGLVGYNEFGTIANCRSSGNVAGSCGAGGLVGWNEGTITNCYSIGGGASGVGSIGGLVGYIYSGTISNCYATGSVSGASYVGGLVGRNYYYATITNCYSTGNVLGGEDIGGLVGNNYGGTIMSSFWDKQTSGMTNSAGGTGKTTAEMKAKSTFTNVGWDFVDETANGTENIWTIHQTVDYPKLVWKIVNFVGWYEVNFADFAFFANYWLQENCASSWDCGGADIDFSDSVDMKDLQIFCQHWLEGPP